MVTIAFIGAKGSRLLGNQIKMGLIEVFKPQNINLLCLPVFPISNEEEFYSQQKFLNQFLDSNRYDGLISWTSQFYTKNNCLIDMEEFLKKTPGLPFVSITRPVKEHPTIYIDDKGGIKKVMKHLIEDHGFKKIAFIRGPSFHLSMELRYQGYIDSLKDYRLPFDNNLVSPPAENFHEKQIMDCVIPFLNELKLKPGEDIQAIVTPTDFFAMGVIKQLISMNVKIPDEIAVTGFNNRMEVLEVFPAISSVNVNFRDIGWQAAKVILALINKQTIPQEIYSQSQLVIRRSCCSNRLNIISSSSKGKTTHFNNNKNINESSLANYKNEIIKITMDMIDIHYDNFNMTLIEELINNFYQDLSHDNSDLFLMNLNKILDIYIHDEQEYSHWQVVIDKIRKILFLKINDSELINRIENILNAAKTLINEKTDYKYALRKKIIVENDIAMGKLSSEINRGFTIENIKKILQQTLSQVGFPSYYLITINDYHDNIQQAKIIDGIKDKIPIDSQYYSPFKFEELLPDVFFMDNQFHYYSIIPLYFSKTILGYIILETPLKPWEFIFEQLHSQLSSALQGVSIFKEKEALLKTLESTNKVLEKAIKEATHANQSKSRFLAIMSHEMRTPLNCIIGFIDLIQENKSQNKTEKYFDIMAAESNKLLGLLNNILDISKIEAGKMAIMREVFNIFNMIDNTITLFSVAAKQANIDLYKNIDKNIPKYLIGDELKISQVIKNLIGNAIQFTIKGSITLSIEIKNKTSTIMTLLFKVTDTGEGISDEKQKIIFNEFIQVKDIFTRKFHSSGLGLTISKNLIELMGGEIGLQSEEKRGSTFWFTLPLKISDKKSLVVKKDKKIVFSKSIIKNSSILIAEDYVVNQEIIKLFLQDFGCHFKIVDNGSLAVKKFNNSNYHIILMDIQMPVLNGIEATKLIRQSQKGKKVPIIALTANVLSSDIQNYLNIGMNDVITKPFHKQYFIDKVIKWLKFSLKK